MSTEKLPSRLRASTMRHMSEYARGYAKEVVIIAVGVLLVGVGYVGVPLIVDAQGATTAKYDANVARDPANKSKYEAQWRQELAQKCQAGSGAGQCPQDPDCKTYCTESGTSTGGLQSCCEGGPKQKPHQPNECPKKADGKCDPKKEEGKTPEMPKMEPPKKEPPKEQPKNPLDQKCDELKASGGANASTADKLACGINNAATALNDLWGGLFGDDESGSGSDETVLDAASGGSSVDDILNSLVTTDVDAEGGAADADSGSGSDVGVPAGDVGVDPNLSGNTADNGNSGFGDDNGFNANTVASTFSEQDGGLLPASDPGFMAQASAILSNLRNYFSGLFNAFGF